MAYAPATLTLDYLKALDPPSFAERDPFELTRFYVTSFEAASGRTLYPGQPEMYVIETMAYAHALMGEAIQAGFLQNRAIWASGAHLDAVGANVSTFRLTAQKASCRVSFALEELRPAAIIVPAGTRVAAGAELVFATTADCIIAAGDLTGEADIEAEEGGTAYNGLLPGQIIDLLDPVAFVADAENITESAGGSDVEADERFRERVCNALERVSGAGPRQGYIEVVKAVNPDIVDVAVIRPQPGFIEITPLMADGVSSYEVDDAIIAALDPERVVPMGDYISIVKAAPVPFDIVMDLKVQPGTAAGMVAVAEALLRDRFAEWTQKLGAQIAPSALVEAVRRAPGVVGVTGPAFAFTDLAANQFATIGVLTVNVVEAPNV